jgi:hypothetical protein
VEGQIGEDLQNEGVSEYFSGINLEKSRLRAIIKAKKEENI